MENVRRFLSSPKQSFFLFGPRGTGKSTWLRSTFPQATLLDLLDVDTARSYKASPSRLRSFVQDRPGQSHFIIDEVQKVPELLSLVHQLIEEKKTRRFILTGSSSRKLKQAGVDMLAGRALLRSLHPFMAGELGGLFALEKGLRQGMLPVVWGSEAPTEVLRSYAGVYLREEVEMEGLLRNAGPFARFMEVSAFSHGALLNASAVARDCQVERKTVETYLSILEDLLLSFRIPVFTKRAKRKITAHPKFYFCDAGVFRSLRPKGPFDRPEEIDGQALEGLVAQHLRAWSSYGGEEHQLFYWRTPSGVEVDFVLYGPAGIWALEVKNTDRLRSEDLRGLQTFAEDYPEAHLIFLYRGTERLRRGQIHILPCEEFLQSLIPGKPPVDDAAPELPRPTDTSPPD